MRGRRTTAIATGLGCLLLSALIPSAASAAFGLLPGAEGFDGAVTLEGGAAATQAGSHPYEAMTRFALNTVESTTGNPIPDGNLKDIRVELPPGLVGNPESTPKCTQEQINTVPVTCPADSQVGIASVTFGYSFGTFENPPVGIYNMVPPPGQPAQFAFRVGAVINMDPEIRTGDDYGMTISLTNLPQTLPVIASKVTFWGVPAATSHESERFCPGTETTGCSSGAAKVPFLTMPTACTGPLTTTIHVDSWEEPGNFASASFRSHDSSGEPVVVSGCDALDFPATMSATVDSAAAASPTGLAVGFHIRQNQSADGRAPANLKNVEVTLPEGMAVNPSAATGLGSCAPAQIALSDPGPASCPDDSKIGTIRIDTPLLDRPLPGAVYLAAPADNPFGSLLAIYIAAHDAQSGLVLKLAGHVEADPLTGRLHVRFDDNPQLPFEDMQVELFGGQRAALVTPGSCGSHTTTAALSPWSGAASTPTASSFQLTTGPAGGACPQGSLEPRVEAGTENPLAGAHSPFVLRLTREDGTQRLSTIAAKLPQGLLAKLRGIPYCPDSALAGISGKEGTGAAELANPSCPAASQVGAVIVGAGAGQSPFRLTTGKAYLAGPYEGAPLSLAIVTPALAGPFDLGSVVVRAALRIDPTTSEVTAVSDPLPTILHGIPLSLRQIEVNLDRDRFTLNPTSCDPMSIEAAVGGTDRASAKLSERFQVGSCERLAFKPGLSLSLRGATRRGGFPALRAVLTQKPGQANIERVSVALPHSEFLAQAHIGTICTRMQFADNACPRGSVYGRARAITPLLDHPLEGPVYLRSNGGERKLPDLVAALKGPNTQPIEIDLVGYIDSVRGGIRTRFQLVPDAPVSKFTLAMKGGRKSLLENSADICRRKHRATVKMDAHNGKIHDFDPVVKAGCGKAGKRKGRHG